MLPSARIKASYFSRFRAFTQSFSAAGRFKNGQVPVLDVDGKQIAQSNAILIYAGKIGNMYPWDTVGALKVDEFLSTIDEVGS